MELTAEILREVLDYDPLTGKLFWKERKEKWFTNMKKPPKDLANMHNGRFLGKEAFTCQDKDGRIYGNLFGKSYRAHRLIWLWMTGEWPKNVVDHIDGNPSNNKWINLRDITKFENERNLNRSKNNTSGCTGVRRQSKGPNWFATIKVNYKNIYLGSFAKIEDAIAARKAAEVKYGFTCR